MTRNTKEVEILGEQVVLSERSAQDIFTFLEMVNDLDKQKIPIKGATDEQDEYFKGIYINAYIIETSLSYYYYGLKFYQIFKKIRLKRKLRRKNLIDKLSVNQLTDYAKIIVSDLEGLNIDGGQIKKKDNPKSDETSPGQ